MPDKFVRRGGAKKRIVKASLGGTMSDESDSFAISSGGEDSDSELLAWLDRGTDSTVHHGTLGSSKLVKRWLPPGNLAELYDHYSVTQSMASSTVASLLGFE